MKSSVTQIPQWTVAQIGAREHYGIPRGFHLAGNLRALHTDMWCHHGQSLLKRGPAIARAFSARRHEDIPSQLVYSHNIASLKRTVFSPRHATRADEYQHHIRVGKWFAESVLRQMQRDGAHANRDRFFSFNTGCLEVLPFLRDHGVFSVVDQIDPARTEEHLVLEEIERWPGWQSKPETIPDVYFERLQAEWDGADLVVVNSEWSRIALIEQGVPGEKIVVVPLSITPDQTSHSKPEKLCDTITILWLGNVILRKGIQYLIEAAKILQNEKRLRFVIAGPIGISESAVKTAGANVEFVGRVTRDRARDYFAAADIFVLPTVSDGFALTQLEAMASGLPVIATPNCGRVVDEGVNGFIVPARDSQQLADRILRLANDHELLEEMSRNALKRSLDFPLSLPTQLIQAAADAAIAQR